MRPAAFDVGFQQCEECLRLLRIGLGQVLGFGWVGLQVIEFEALDAIHRFGRDRLVHDLENPFGQQELPIPLPISQGELVAILLVNTFRADGAGGRLGKESGQDAVTINAGAGGERHAGEVGKGGHHVGKIHHLLAGRAGFDMTGPPRDERLAMPALVILELVAAIDTGTIMAIHGRILLEPKWSVIRAEDDEGILRQSLFFQGLENLTDAVIDRHHEITIFADLAFALEFSGREPWRVRPGECQIEKKGLRLARAALEVVVCLGRE